MSDPSSARRVERHYEDPLAAIWLGAARAIGLKVERSSEVYASTDGRGSLTLGVDESLDADDGLAQMIFHELCHSLIEGPEAFDQPDWGLDNESARDLEREHACLRLQAFLARRHGLGGLLAPTTEHRVFYDALGPDPFSPGDEEPSVSAARLGVWRSGRDPWAPHLAAALEASAHIARAAAPFVSEPSLLASFEEPAPPHPGGLPSHPAPPAGASCGSCAWQRAAGPGPKRSRCLQLGSARIEPDWSPCERFEAALDCQRCGACCRGAYQAVELSARDPMVHAHPALVRRRDRYLEVAREGDRCAALEGSGRAAERFSCRIYQDRPRTCRDFTVGSEHCLDARRRVGLSL